MATWQQLGRENLDAAKALLDGGHFRSCLSRSYYAAYSAITGALHETGHGVGGRGRPNPSHEQLATMARYNLNPRRIDEQSGRDIARRVRLLQRFRVMADYDPQSAIERDEALMGVRAASTVVSRLEAAHGGD